MPSAHQLPRYATTVLHARMRYVLVLGVVVSVVNLVVWDACCYLPWVALLGWWLGWWHGRGHALRLRRAQQDLVRARSFALRTQALPRPPQLASQQWQPAWVPFLLLVETLPASASAAAGGQRWRKVLRADAAWQAVLHAQRCWLQRHAPARWQAVSQWWQRWHVEPWRRRYGESLAQAQAATSVELLCGIGLAGDERLWCQRIGFGPEGDGYLALAHLLLALADSGLCALRTSTPRPGFPRHQLPVAEQFFIGEGFPWHTRHAQALDELKLQATGEGIATEQGDPRIFGIGHADACARFMDESQFNQMTGIFGATGVGKTRFAEVVMVQVIQSGLPLVVIDPKGDQALTNRVLETCRLAGRGHQFQYFSLAAPTRKASWRYLSRYNPCSTYTDPAELAARIASVLPTTRDPFWTNVAKAMVETCLTLCHWLNWYLRFLGRGADGTPAAGDCGEVPPVLLALQWARHHPTATPQQAQAALAQLRRERAHSSWRPRTQAEREVEALLGTRAASGAALYSALEWLPSVRHIAEYEIDKTAAFLGWALKILYFHRYLDTQRQAAPDFPRHASASELLALAGSGEEGSLWSRYLSAARHPLQERVEGVASPEHERTRAFYDYFVPGRAGDGYELTRMFTQVQRTLDAHYSDCCKERQKFLEYATTLQSALTPFLGERSRILCSSHSDIVWQQVVEERQVVYCALSSMIDDQGATACAKLLIHDLSAHFGRRYQYQAGTATPVYLVADEVGSFINEPFIHLLNKCRGVGLRALIIGQTRADLAKQLGADGAQQALGNLNTVIQLRAALQEDARAFSARAGDAKIVQESRTSSLSPRGTAVAAHLSGEFAVTEAISYSAQRVARVPADAVMALPRGQAFVHSQGQVQLLAQGLLNPVSSDLFAEIGMHPGVMREDLRPALRESAGATGVTPREPTTPAGALVAPSAGALDQALDQALAALDAPRSMAGAPDAPDLETVAPAAAPATVPATVTAPAPERSWEPPP